MCLFGIEEEVGFDSRASSDSIDQIIFQCFLDSDPRLGLSHIMIRD